MERRMQWALHRLHTLEERMLQIETAGGAYNGESSGLVDCCLVVRLWQRHTVKARTCV